MVRPGHGRRRWRLISRPLLSTGAALIAALAAAGCVSIPNAGPVVSVPVTQGPNAQGEPYQQVVIGPPGAGWLPAQIVQGFLAASASFGDNWQVAREYMTPEASREWNPSWSAIVYNKGPNVTGPVYAVAATPKPAATAKPVPTAAKTKSRAPEPNLATVAITGSILANLSGAGSYAVPSASGPRGLPGVLQIIKLVKVAGLGQWRISSAPSELLLTSDSFDSDYQLRNLYFFDPTTRFLVPDPVYVPLQATPADLMNGLVDDLRRQPKDWLSGGATRTAFPVGTTRIGDVTLDGVTAVVNLDGSSIARASASASSPVMQQVSAQLFLTLSGSGQDGQAVQAIEVEVNGKPWIPGNSQGDPIQHPGGDGPATGASKTFYYLDAGYIMSRDGANGAPVRVERVGAGYSQVAASPDGQYLALIRNDGDLFTGRVGGTPTRRGGGDYTTMSWDVNDDLWATTNGQVVMLRGAVSLGQPIAVSVVNVDGTGTATAPTEVRIAPDGVRAAIVLGYTELTFGAISWHEGADPGKPTLRIVLSPFSVPTVEGATFTSLTWYGADNVITLTEPDSNVTEYPVNGGAATPISATAQMQSISSSGSALIAGLAKGRMAVDASLTGSWMSFGNGLSPAYPG